MSDGGTTISIDFHFNTEGLIESFSATRPRAANGDVVDALWGGRMQAYGQRAGMRIPFDGEVSWLQPGGAYPYWRGHLTQIEYEFQR